MTQKIRKGHSEPRVDVVLRQTGRHVDAPLGDPRRRRPQTKLIKCSEDAVYHDAGKDDCGESWRRYARGHGGVGMDRDGVRSHSPHHETPDIVLGGKREEFMRPILEKYDAESSAYYSTARLWDDGIIDPLDTRMVLALGLSAALHSPWPERRSGVVRASENRRA